MPSSSSSAFSLTAHDVGLSRGDFVVIDAVDVAVGPGTRLGVVGPNGVGKTTLLRLLAGIDTPDRGAVTRRPASLRVGYLPQEPGFRDGETLPRFLARRAGVAAAESELELAAAALAASEPGADVRYPAALEAYLDAGGPDFGARMAAVCDDVGLEPRLFDVPLRALSGGQAARALLAAILLSRFDVFLLDEPTNDLDFAGLTRLEEFVESLPGGVVLVSHDRAFLERSVTRVLELDEHTRRGTEFGGGWKAYLDARATTLRHAEEAYAGYRSERTRLEERARTQRQWAVQGVRASKKRPQDHDRAQRDFRTNRTEKQAGKVHATEQAITRLARVEKPWEGWDLTFQVARAPRSGDVVVRLAGAMVERGEFRLGPVDLQIGWGERVAIIGPNGSGKTTLIKTLLGLLPLVAGDRTIGPSVRVGEVDQARIAFSSEATLLDAFTRATGLLVADTRSLLAKFGLGADDVTRRASTLSPGERTRAILARFAAEGVNMLVLDEPTNHLDLPAIEQLEAALDIFDGTLVLVSHDRRLLEAVRITRTIAADGSER